MRRRPLAIAFGLSLLPLLPAQANWVRRTSAGAPPVRQMYGLAPGPGNTILLFGGSAFPLPSLGDTWILDDAGWRLAMPAVAPSARTGPGMAFDIQRGRVVLFGGSASTGFFDDTWEWNGAAWLLRSTSARPSRRSRCAMEYDLVRGTTVLFGGRDAASGGLLAVGETWEWDGFVWTQKNTATAPAPRYDTAMAFDLASFRMVMFGGTSPLVGYLADTWEYDGANWQLLNPAHSPSPRSGHAMASDWRRNRVVLFGGAVNSNYSLADTWEWDGADWLLRVPTVSPPGRSSGSQVLDLARNRIVLFGGGTGPLISLGDTWEYFTTAVPSVATLAPGCAGTAGTAWLAAQLPWLGDALQVTAYATPPGAPVLLALGRSSTTWGTLSLPASLAAFGMPGCALAVSGDATIPMTGVVPTCTLTLPPNNAFAGMSLFAQALVVDPAANAAGCVLSSALALQLGAR